MRDSEYVDQRLTMILQKSNEEQNNTNSMTHHSTSSLNLDEQQLVARNEELKVLQDSNYATSKNENEDETYRDQEL